MSGTEGPPSSRRTAPGRPTFSRTGKIGLGLVLTLVGLFLLTLLLPTDPSRLSTLLPVAGAGIVVLWVGGILMGVGSRS